jgi:LPXTG-motif cell wall-anchored protein
MKRSKLLLRLAIGAFVIAAPLTIATAAYATTYSSPSVSASTTTPAPGGSLTVTGTGFMPNSAVVVEIHSAPVVLANLTSDANGDASSSVTVPSSFSAGSSHTITLTGVDPSSASHVDSLSIVLAGSSSLPSTGVQVLSESALGAVLVGFGAFLVFVSRRRKAARVEIAA